MKKFSIPGYFTYYDLCKALIEYRRTHLNYFYDDRIIDSVYDFPPGSIWDGGRSKLYQDYNVISLDNIMKYYMNYTNIKFNHTCTNCLIKGDLVKDRFSNYFFDNYYRDEDSVIIASDDLRKYLREKFPNIRFIYSATRCVDDIEEINKITQSEIFVLNYIRNNDNEYLKQINNLPRIEVICAELCDFNCNVRKRHYEVISKDQLWDIKDPFRCPYQAEARLFEDGLKLPHAITNERVDELAEMGIQYFKISGRTLRVPQWIETMTYYLVKPEYLNKVRFDLLNQLW